MNKSEAKLLAAMKGQTLMPDDEPGVDRSKCRARKRIYIGQGVGGGTWVQCSKNPWPGHKTCHWHKHIEEV
jgi:hypothetical protein